MSSGSQRNSKLALVLLVVVALVAARQFGVFEHLGSPSEAKHTLVRLAGWGYLAFILAYALLQPFGVPGGVFIWVAPLIWPWPTAFLVSMAGTQAASLVGFSFSRFVARDWVEKKIPARFSKYSDATTRRAFATVFSLRLIFWMHPLLHAFFGLSKVPFWTHFWGSLLGYVVPLFMVSYFGQKLFEFLSDAPSSVWGFAGVVVALLVLGLWLYRERVRRTACGEQS